MQLDSFRLSQGFQTVIIGFQAEYLLQPIYEHALLLLSCFPFQRPSFLQDILQQVVTGHLIPSNLVDLSARESADHDWLWALFRSTGGV